MRRAVRSEILSAVADVHGEESGVFIVIPPRSFFPSCSYIIMPLNYTFV